MSKEYLTVDNKLIMVDGKLVEVPANTELSDVLDAQESEIITTQNEGDKLVDEIVGYVDGSPRGVYASLSALQSAFPSGAQGVYVCLDNGHWYYWNGSAWADGGVYQAAQIKLNEVVLPENSTWITSSTVIDFNNYKTYGYYVLGEINSNSLNIPNGIDKTKNYLLEVRKNIYNSTSNYIVSQTLTSLNGSECVIYTRQLTYLNGSETWGEWSRTFKASDLPIIGINYDDIKPRNGSWMTSYYTVDLNDYKDFKLICFGQFNNNSTNLPAGIDKTKNYLFRVSKFIYQPNQKVITTQELILLNGDKTIVYTRYYENINNAWSEWKSSYQEEQSYHREKVEIGVGKTFTTLIAGTTYAFNKGNCDVYIYDGVYDLISEGVPTSRTYGLKIGNNCKYYFSSNSKVVCHYEGTDLNVKENLSVFDNRVGDGDFEMYNATIEASNIRYCVHDENGSPTDATPYSHKFIGCKMSINNSNNPVRDGVLYHCIGGGLGASAYIYIDSCYFNSINAYNGESSINGDVSYHGNYASSDLAKAGTANIIVKNCYFAHNFTISEPNNETNKKYVLFTNNSYKNRENVVNGIFYNETSSTYWDVKEWNNSARN